MRVNVLSGVTVHTDNGPIDIPQRKLRQVICVLLLAGPSTSEELKTLLWDDDDERDYSSALTTTLSKLRRAAPGLIIKHEDRYRLPADVASDVDAFRELLKDASAIRSVYPTRAAVFLSEALALWSPTPLADLPPTGAAKAAARRLLHLRREATEALVEIRLALGAHGASLATNIRDTLDDDPTNEHLWAQLMLCLHRDGRSADALRTYQEARDVLATEVGAPPGTTLTRMRDSIRRQDPALDWRPPAPPSTPEERAKAAGIDVTKPAASRIYDYLLGGKENFPADRKVAEDVIKHIPDLVDLALTNREFLRRVVRMLAKLGVRQFIDLGAGLPTVNNTHEVAQRVAPDARVVYVDNEPTVRLHALALLADTPGAGFVEADVRDPHAIMSAPATVELIDFDEPLAVLALNILHFLADEEMYPMVSTFMDRAAPGSYLVVSTITSDGTTPTARAALDTAANQAGQTLRWRTREELDVLVEGMELVDPGMTALPEWRPDIVEDPSSLVSLVTVARKP